MERWVFITAVITVYLGVTLAIGLLAGRKATHSVAGYVAGDRSFGLLVMYFVTGATVFSSFAFLGGPGWAYSRGAAAFYILSYGTLGLAPWYFFGPRVAALGRRFGYVTQAELFAHRFQSPALSGLLALISLVSFLPYLTLQMQGAGYVFNVVTEGRMQDILKKELRVLVYTVNDLEDARWLVAAGVSGVFTDRPDVISTASLAARAGG